MILGFGQPVRPAKSRIGAALFILILPVITPSAATPKLLPLALAD